MDPNPNWLGPLLTSIALLISGFVAAFAGLGLVALALVFLAFAFYDTAKDRREFRRSLRAGRAKA